MEPPEDFFETLSFVAQTLALANEYFQKGKVLESQGNLEGALSSFSLAADQLFVLPREISQAKVKEIMIHRADLALRMGNKADVAIASASVLIEDENWNSIGYLFMGNAWLAKSSPGDALLYFLEGHNKYHDDPDIKVSFLHQISILAFAHPEAVSDAKVSMEKKEWPAVIRRLAEDNKWEVINMLLVGTRYANTFLEQAAKGCVTKNVNVGALVSYLSQQALINWGQNLAVQLLEGGASPCSLTSSPSELPHLCALKLGLRTGGFQILKYLLQSVDEASKSKVDENGDSAMHIVVKSPAKNTTNGETAAKILMHHKFPVDTQDKSGKLPIDYLVATDQLYKLFQLSHSQKADVLNRVQLMKDNGKIAMNKGRFRDALVCYNEGIRLTKTVGDKRQLSILFSNRSAAYSKLNQPVKALNDAEMSISHDSTWPKGFWRKGQVLLAQKNYMKAVLAFYDGYQKGERGDNACHCLVEALILLDKHPNPYLMAGVLSVLELIERRDLVFVIHQLVQKSEWSALKLIIFDESNKDTGLRKAVHSFTLPNLSLRSLARAVEICFDDSLSWKSDLLCVLLRLGADLNSLSCSKEDTMYHAALRISLHTENLYFLEKALQTNTPLARECVNSYGDSLFHKLVKSNKQTEYVATKAAKLMLKYRVNSFIEDSAGKPPVSYLPLDCPMRALIDHRATPDVQELEKVLSLKVKGNKAVQEGDNLKAVTFYSDALTLADGLVVIADRELAILFSNRSEAYRKLNRLTEALQDANSCVKTDSNWYKGHFRKAKALYCQKLFKESSESFKRAYSLFSEKTSDAAVEILAEYCQACFECNSNDFKTILPDSQFVFARILLQLIEIDSMDAANFLFHKFRPTKDNPSDKVKTGTSLKAFCCPQLLCKEWPQPVIICLIQHGADKTTLKRNQGDTYLHVALIMLLNTGCDRLLVFLTQFCPTDELNITDSEGNTLLHVAVKTPCHPQLKYDVITWLCERGVAPQTRNKAGKAAVNLLKGHPKCRQLIMKLVQEYDKQGEQSKKKNPKKDSKKTGQASKVKSNFDESRCDCCLKHLSQARDHFVKNLLVEAINELMGLLRVESHKTKRHSEMYEDGLSLMIDVLSVSPRPEIPKSLLKASDGLYQTLLDKLALGDKWRQVETMITAWIQDKPLSNSIATGLSVCKVLSSNSLQGDANYRHQVIQKLLDNGASLATPDDVQEPISLAIEKQDYRVIPLLIDYGADPRKISIQPTDTPLHAALEVALVLDKGYFDLFKKLQSLFVEDSQKFPYLNPTCVDSENNGLYHIAAKCDYSKHAKKATELLCEWKVPCDRMDNNKKTPLQYITKQNDDRRAFLKMAATFQTTSEKKSKKSSSRMFPGKSSEKKFPTLSKPTTGKTEVDVQARADELKPLPVKTKTRREECRQTILNHINALPDFAYETYLEDKQQTEKSTLEDVDSDLETSPCHSRSSSPTEIDNIDIAEAIQNGLLDDDEDEVDEAGDRVEKEEDSLEIDSRLFDDLEWEVECTADVWKILKSRHVPFEFKKRAILKIQKLASGEWTKSLVKDVHNVPKSLKLFEAKISKGGRILWELAVTFSARCTETSEKIFCRENEGQSTQVIGQMYAEVIRVWDIVLQHDQLYHQIQRVVNSHSRGEESIIKRNLKCLDAKQFNPLTTIGKRLPRLFTEIDDDNEHGFRSDDTRAVPYFPPASPNESEFNVMKFYPFSQALVNFILQNIDIKVDFPFRVTSLEHAIISLPPDSPILLMGRSGTGKTTCCLYRLWHCFVKYWTKANEAQAPLLPNTLRYMQPEEEDDQKVVDTEDEDDDDSDDEAASDSGQAEEESTDSENNEEEDSDETYEHLQQVFVTKNAVLCSEVLKNFQQLKHASDLDTKHTDLEEISLPCRLTEIPVDSYPLFVTSRQLLLMLDASLPEPTFFERDSDGSLKRDIKGWNDADTNLAFIPDLDSDSEEEAESDMNDSELGENESKPTTFQQNPRREVTYEVFAEEIWPKIIQMKNKKSSDYHPSLIWMEIHSFIKGSFEALNTKAGHLTSDQYVEMGKKRAPNFTGERDKVFQIFQSYERLKKQKGMFDECDLLYHVSNRLSKTQPIWTVHQLYVDETQDFTQAELSVLLRLCQNPNSTFLTGDTAQGIMRGISFRFSDLKSLFHYAKESLHIMGKSKTITVPRCVYQLSHNYRSHAGILALASSVVDLMREFFPESFDNLNNDQGLFPGPLPVLLESCSFGDLAVLLKGNHRQTSQIEFGAHQAILVVNQEAKEAVPKELQLGLVLTIFEAKGLEFDDVLLFNFFTDSQARKEWRVVTEYLHRLANSQPKTHENSSALVEIDIETLNHSTCRPLTFDDKQHKVLCSELKHLYTALTRARVNVWIFDEDEEARRPMFDYFTSRQLVRPVTVNTDQTQGIQEMFAEKSSPDEWTKRGNDFMKKHLYEVAAKCYAIAGNTKKENQALAHCAALNASKLRDSPAKMKQEFLYIAERYLVQCGMLAEAAKCLQNAKEKELAARLYEKSGQLEKAVDVFKKCKLTKDAARCLEQLGHFREAITLLTKNDCYELAFDVLKRFQIKLKDFSDNNKAPPSLLQKHTPTDNQSMDNLAHSAASYYNKRQNFEQMKAALENLSNVKERVVFLKKKGHASEAAKVLKKSGNYQEAADLFLRVGNLDEAQSCSELSGDVNLIAKCGFVKCKQRLSEVKSEKESCPGSPVPSDLPPELRNILGLFNQAKNFTMAAEVKLVLGETESNSDMILGAWSDFQRLVPPNEAGQVECSNSYKAQGFLEADIDAQLKFASGHLVQLLHVLHLTHKVNPTASEKTKIALYKTYYGFEHSESALRFLPHCYPRCLQFMDDKTGKTSEKEFQRNIQRYFLRLLRSWVEFLQDASRFSQMSNSLCKTFASGSLCESSSCEHLHEPLTKQTLYSFIKAWLTTAHIQGSLSRFSEKASDQILNRNLRSLHKESVGEHVSFLGHFFASSEMLHFEASLSLVKEFLRVFTNKDLMSYLKEELEQIWKGTEFKLKIKTTDLFVASALVCKLVDNSLEQLNKWLKEIEDEFSSKAHKDRGWIGEGQTMIGERGKRFNYFMSYSRRFVEALELLYKPSPVKPVKQSFAAFGKFLKLLSNKRIRQGIPELEHLFFWMEFFFAFNCCVSAKVFGDCLILPESYLDRMNLVEGVFGGKTEYYALNFCHTEYLRHQFLSDKKRDMIEILLCKMETNETILEEILNPINDNFDSGLAERALVFCLALLSNPCSRKCHDDLFKAVIAAVSNPALADQPPRLRNVITQIHLLQGSQDMTIALKNVLEARHHEKLFNCSWKSKGSKMPYGLTMKLVTAVETNSPSSRILDVTSVPLTSEVKDMEPIPDDDLEAFQDDDLEPFQDDDLGPTAEEIQSREDEIELEFKKNLAGEVIFRCLRWVQLYHRAEKLTTHILNDFCRHQVSLPEKLNSDLQNCVLDHSMCGICQVVFLTDQEKKQMYFPNTPEKEHDKPVYSSELSQERDSFKHCRSLSHKENVFDYLTLRYYIEGKIVPLLKKVESVEQAEGKAQALSRDISRLSEVWRSVQENIREIATSKKWTDVAQLKKSVKTLSVELRRLAPLISKETVVQESSKGSHSFLRRKTASDEEESDIEEVVPDVEPRQSRRIKKNRNKKLKK